jgi:hypothetical protein
MVWLPGGEVGTALPGRLSSPGGVADVATSRVGAASEGPWAGGFTLLVPLRIQLCGEHNTCRAEHDTFCSIPTLLASLQLTAVVRMPQLMCAEVVGMAQRAASWREGCIGARGWVCVIAMAARSEQTSWMVVALQHLQTVR